MASERQFFAEIVALEVPRDSFSEKLWRRGLKNTFSDELWRKVLRDRLFHKYCGVGYSE